MLTSTNNALLPQIWLIDDSPFDLYFNSSVIDFTSSGCPVSMISSGKEALEMLYANMEYLEDSTYIILLDIKMPQMDGFDFLNEFGKLPERVKSKFSIYLLSAFLDEDNKIKAKEYRNIIDCISKPLSVQSLSNTVFKNFLDNSSLN